MPASLRAHLRYPEDLLSVQSATYGRYHIINPLAFYNATNAWNVSPNAGAGSPNLALPTISTFSTSSSGTITTQVAPMAPEYELFKVPGQSTQSFNLVDAFVPVSTNDQIQTMSGFVVAGSDPSNYGKLTVFQTPPIDGPALIDSDISATQAISTKISYLNQQGSSVYLGTLQVVPVGNSMLYFRPFYVSSSRNLFPKLDYYIVVYAGSSGQSKVAFQPTLQAALQNLFQVNPISGSTQPPGTSTGVSPTVQNLITQANQAVQQAQTDLRSGDFAAYGNDEATLKNVLQQLAEASQASTSSPTKAKPTTTTTPTTTTSAPSGVALGPIKG
jgi:uncharacterized membrane protein (UPF0182 family)